MPLTRSYLNVLIGRMALWPDSLEFSEGTQGIDSPSAELPLASKEKHGRVRLRQLGGYLSSQIAAHVRAADVAEGTESLADNELVRMVQIVLE